jgi:hypothetical protein
LHPAAVDLTKRTEPYSTRRRPDVIIFSTLLLNLLDVTDLRLHELLERVVATAATLGLSQVVNQVAPFEVQGETMETVDASDDCQQNDANGGKCNRIHRTY